ncbi:MAG TPA: poly-beta-1,6-N-acetyl-D-glucosamine biosynthesis protein PgaD [Spongiibacteraceae bacterium]|jgi:biofilm PGA synthesis protein PgaD|nr:poly-beta-1,6-N-acetyl-D-glucosamine biosynthesis protein PgaD [Spongiibacteraceae bacterium]HUH36845.1 poly-beta-1,6-N-acetyl-D-glucosamine biosynthesis protein PgaD [Spongiibacteraceae bacterium]
MTADELIIDNARLVRPGQKLTALGITLLFWGMLLYLWQPLISLLAWGFNIRVFYSHMVILGGYQAFLDLLVFYSLIILCLAGVLLVWARVQLWRFADLRRRQAGAPVTTGAMAARFGISPAQLEAARARRELRVSLTVDGAVAHLQPESVG